MRDTRQTDMLELLAVGIPASHFATSNEGPIGYAAPNLPSRSVAWDQLLAGSAAATRVRIHVSARWDQKVLERMVEPGRHWRILWFNGLITEYGPRSTGPEPLRTIFMTDDQARKLHTWAPLVQVWWEAAYAWFRFAEGEETPAAELRMPTGALQ